MLDEAIQTAGQSYRILSTALIASTLIPPIAVSRWNPQLTERDLVPTLRARPRVKDRKGSLWSSAEVMVQLVLFLHHSDILARAFCSRLPCLWTTLADDNLYLQCLSTPLVTEPPAGSWDLYKQLFPNQYLGEVDPSQVSSFCCNNFRRRRSACCRRRRLY